MKIAIIEPRINSQKNIVRDVLYGCWCAGKRIGGAKVPPLEQLRLATMLEKDGHNVVFCDAQAEQLDFVDVVNRIRGAKLAVFSTSVMTVNADASYAKKLCNSLPGLKTCVYGSHPTFRPEDTLTKGFNFVIRREPEETLLVLANAIEQGVCLEGLSSILGLGTIVDDKFIINDFRPFVSDLDAIPPINPNFLPKKVEYFNPIVVDFPYLTISTSHGCPGKCLYCTAPFFHGSKTRMQSAGKVLKDIEYYIDNGIKELYFRDETFTANRQRVVDICQGILDKKMNFSWICNSRVDTVDLDLLSIMQKSGCHLVKFGVESGNQRVLDASHKGILLDQTRQAFYNCNKLKLDTHAHFMIGMPTETLESVEDTLRFAFEIKPTTATFGICTPYPGTPLFKSVKKLAHEINDGSYNADLEHLHVEGSFNYLFCKLTSEELQSSLKRCYKKFYFRFSYLFMQILRIKNKKMLRNALIGGMNILLFSTSKEYKANE